MDKIVESYDEFLNESSWDKGVVLTYKPSMFKKERPVKTSRDISIALDDAGINNTWSAKTGEVFITKRNELSKAQKAIKGLDIEFIDESIIESYDEFLNEVFKQPKLDFDYLFQIVARKEEKDGSREKHEVKVKKDDNLNDIKKQVLKDYPNNKYYYILFKTKGKMMDRVETNESVNESKLVYKDMWDELDTWAKSNKFPAWKLQKDHLKTIAPSYDINIDDKEWKKMIIRYDELWRKDYFKSWESGQSWLDGKISELTESLNESQSPTITRMKFIDDFINHYDKSGVDNKKFSLMADNLGKISKNWEEVAELIHAGDYDLNDLKKYLDEDDIRDGSRMIYNFNQDLFIKSLTKPHKWNDNVSMDEINYKTFKSFYNKPIKHTFF